MALAGMALAGKILAGKILAGNISAGNRLVGDMLVCCAPSLEERAELYLERLRVGLSLGGLDVVKELQADLGGVAGLEARADDGVS